MTTLIFNTFNLYRIEKKYCTHNVSNPPDPVNMHKNTKRDPKLISINFKSN